MSYLLDTNIISHPSKKNPSPKLMRRMALVPPQQQFTSAITIGEMVCGALRSNRPEALLARFEEDVLPFYTVLPFDFEGAKVYGKISSDLERKGRPIDEADLRIASIALANNLTLVTDNVRHFVRIEGLTVENWLE